MNEFYKLDKTILRTLGSDAAVLFAVLANNYQYFKKHNLLNDGYFFCTIEHIYEETLLARRRQESALKLLIDNGYLIKKIVGMPARRYFKIDYSLYEKYKQVCTNRANKSVQSEQTSLDNSSKQVCTDKPCNKNKDNKNKEIRINNKNKEREFKPPTYEDVLNYHQERDSDVDPKKFFDYYEASGWVDGNGKKVRNWKQKFITWEGRGKKAKPSYIDEIQRGLKELEAMFNE